MSYTAMYRRFRPTTFEEVKGQDAIVTTLKNQIRSDRIGHAYLFCGTRGTGKTSIAKLFAKSVNCEHPVDGSPCGECASCKAIAEGRSMNVIEIDAASNNGVDNIREIVNEVAYSPTEGKYRVYIIDEVHMLSAGAFNALLKTLEEPPSYVIFILATTEIQKVPATILSRCQRYDFTRIGPEDIAQRVEYIAGQEGLELSGEGAELISRLADGAMRDALSILDTCAGVTAKIDADVVRRMAGVTDRSYLPPYPTEPLTAEQAVENYNWYERRRTELLGTTPRTSLNRDGSWAVQPSAYVSWSQWIELEKGAGEWSPVAWTVDQDGRVTGWSVTWDAAGNPYQTELEVLEPAMNILSPLLFALAPEAGEGSFLCQERFTQARRASLHMVLSILEDTRLQGAGTQGKVQGMGGVTLELEVLTARGYSRTSYSDGMTKLDQEDPGAGDLVIRFTASLTEG